jgi:CDP-paratose 2-epimerase
MAETILITGGAGFVGSNLCMKLKEDNPSCNIIAFDNLKRRGSELNVSRMKSKGITFIHGDVRNIEDLEALPHFDIMIECSAEPSVMAGVDSSPLYLLNTNLMGTLNCLESVRKNKAKIIFLSTSRVYPIEALNRLNLKEDKTRFTLDKKQSLSGCSENGIKEDFPLEGARSLYGSTKLCSELMIKEYEDSYGVKNIINRCGVIAGPWQFGKVDQGFIVLWVARHFFKGKLSYIGYEGKGKQVRDIIHIDDLYDLLKIQIKDFDKYQGSTYNVGGGIENSTSLLELTDLCQKITGNKIIIDSVRETRKGDIKVYITDSSKIKSIAQWKPKRSVEQTVKDVYDWIKSNQESLKEILA